MSLTPSITGATVLNWANVSTFSYATKTFDFSAQTNNAKGFVLSGDGTKLYVVENDTDVIYQYTLSTAWDISTASYDSKSFDVTAQEANPQSLNFKPDGTTMYVTGDGSSGDVWQYTLSAPWDVSTASYATKVLDTSSQETSPGSCHFRTGGDKLYILGTGDVVYQYTLSTPWDVSTASYASKSFTTSGQEGNAEGLFFRPDGYKMYLVGRDNDTVYQYSLSIAWDVSTASYDSNSLSVNTQEPAPYGLHFRPDGSKFYILGSGDVFQYDA